MKYTISALALASCLVVPAVVSATSLSGIVLYAATDMGEPNGVRTLDGELQAQLWRTAVGGEWHILGVWNGLPPQSLAAPPLNSPDAMVEIPLSDGENDFTLMGQPGANTAVDEYYRFAINLYFDSALDHPGISVLIPRNNSPSGSPVSPNRSDFIYSLGLQQVSSPPQMTYDDGVVSVSVLAASFLDPETFNLDVDKVQAQRLIPSGPGDPNASDYIGVLKVMVGPSASGGQAAAGLVAPAVDAIPHGIADSGTLRGPEIPIAGARPALVDEPGVAADRGGARGRDVVMAEGETEPTAAETGVPAGTVTPAGATPQAGTPTPPTTPSPKATGSASPIVVAAASVTPATTGTSATPAPHTSSTAAAVATPTPSRRSK